MAWSGLLGRHSSAGIARGIIANPQRFLQRAMASSTTSAAGAAHASATNAQAAPKAAIMVIGNEVLNGSIADTNTPWLAKLLYSRGVDVVRVEFVPDDIEDIKSTVKGLRERVGQHGFVFSSGGIGPTHDDVTYEAMAQAFGAQLELHQPTVDRMQADYSKRGLELNAARLRMATLPTPAEVLYTEGLWVPLVNLNGVYILPGIPRLFKAMVTAHQDRFSGPLSSSAQLYTDAGEGDVAEPLRAVAAAHPSVAIGSYPATEDGRGYKVKLAFTSRDPDALQAAVAAAREAVPQTFDTLL